VLAAMLIDDAAATHATTVLTDDAFYAEKHRRLFRAMRLLVETGTSVDPVTLSNVLASRGDLEASGGKDYIGFLVDAVPTAANVAYHAGIVREWATRRLLLATLEASVAAVKDGETAKDAARAAFSALLPYTAETTGDEGFVHARSIVYPTMEAIEQTASGKGTGLLTGWRKIDEEMGGLRPGELVIPGGAEKMGKSVFALNLCLRIASRKAEDGGGGCAYVSAEMTKEALMKRCLAWESRVDARKIRTGQLVDGDWPALANAGAVISRLPLWIDDQATPSLADIIARATHLKALHPELRLVVVDFLQLVRDRRKGVPKSEELSDIAYGLKALAKKLGIVVVAPCQVNTKDVEELKDPRPRLKDLQGSSGMRQAADLIGLLYRPAVYDPMGNPYEIEVNFAAAREAPPFLARLRWDASSLRIDDHGPAPIRLSA
jgi:replicative DNA helicase